MSRSEPALSANEVGDIIAFRRTNSETHSADTPVVCPSSLDEIGSALSKPKGKFEFERGNTGWAVFFVHLEARKSTVRPGMIDRADNFSVATM